MLKQVKSDIYLDYFVHGGITTFSVLVIGEIFEKQWKRRKKSKHVYVEKFQSSKLFSAPVKHFEIKSTHVVCPVKKKKLLPDMISLVLDVQSFAIVPLHGLVLGDTMPGDKNFSRM